MLSLDWHNRPFSVIVGGFPRSGTRYLARAIQELGLKVGHEKTQRDGGVGYDFIDPLRCPGYEDIKIFALVTRDPRYAIASAEASFGPNWGETKRREKNYFEFWFQWLTLGRAALEEATKAGAVAFSFKLEELEGENCGLKKIADLLSLRFPADGFRVTNRENHRGPYRPYKWDELPDYVTELAEKLGYKPEVLTHADA